MIISPDSNLRTGSGRRGNWLKPTHLSNCVNWLPSRYAAKSDGAALFTRANSEYLSASDNAALSAGANNIWVNLWVKLTTKANDQGIAGKWAQGTTNEEEWLVYYDATADRFIFYVSPDGAGTIVGATADNLGAVSTATWYNIFGYYDDVNDLIGIIIDDGTADTTSHTTGVYDGTEDFRIGAFRQDGALSSDYLDGEVDSVVIGKEPPTGMAAVSAAIATYFYNSGNGRKVTDISAANQTAWGVTAGYELDEIDGARADAIGSNNLTDNNTVTSSNGVPEGDVDNLAAISRLSDMSVNSNDPVQATPAAKPEYQTGTFGALPGLYFDGTDDYLQVSSDLTLSATDDITLVYVGKNTNASVSSAEVFAHINEASQQSLLAVGYIDSATNFLAASRKNTAGLTQRSNTSFSINAAHVVIVTVNGTTDAITIYLNGNDVTVADAGFALTGQAADNFTVGAQQAGSVTSYLDGDIAELAVYDRILTTGEIWRLSRRLGNLYQIAV